MKIIFIVDETLILLPKWLDTVIENLPKEYQIQAITPAGHKKGQKTLFTYLNKNILMIKPIGLLKLSVFTSLQYINWLFYKIRLSQTPATISQVAEKHCLKKIETNNVNDPSYLSKIKKLKPDIIFSSGSQIFKEDLLSLPKIACINRHSGALPSYGGLFPIFQALIHNEKKIGVTIHYMVKEIDKGKIIYQEVFKVKKTDTLLGLYETAYKISVHATIKALEIIRLKKKPVVINKLESSYYSFPNDEDWKKFWRKKYKFI